MKTKTLNTRTNARKLTAYLKRQGLSAVAPRQKDSNGKWDVSCTVTRKRQSFVVKNGKAVKVANYSDLKGKLLARKLHNKNVTTILNSFA